MYYLSQPPFLILIIGLFIALTFGSAFQSLIQQRIKTWAKNPKADDSYRLGSPDLVATYWGICSGVWIFLAGGLLIFGFGVIVSYGFALPLTIFTASLIWSQLQDVFLQLKEGGFQAIDLDNFK